MKFLTFEKIKQQLRLDDCIPSGEKQKVIGYGESAEITLLNYIDRTYDEVVAKYGSFPAPLEQAALMLVDLSYQYRSPVNNGNLSVVPYGFDILVKPYIKL